MTPRAKQIKELDDLYKACIKLMYPKCVWCGSTKMVTGDHIFTAQHYSTRWQLANIIGLCRDCHIYRKEKAPMEWALMVINYKGLDVIRELFKFHALKAENVDLLAVKEMLQKRLDAERGKRIEKGD